PGRSGRTTRRPSGSWATPARRWASSWSGSARARRREARARPSGRRCAPRSRRARSEEHTSELQSRFDLVCRLLLEKKKPLAYKLWNAFSPREHEVTCWDLRARWVQGARLFKLPVEGALSCGASQRLVRVRDFVHGA